MRTLLRSMFVARCLLVLISMDAAAVLAATTISGRVTDETGKPIAGMPIIINPTFGGGETDAQGNYTVDVPPGSYFVNACDCGVFNLYVDTWYPNVWDTDFWRNLVPAKPVTVNEGGNATADFSVAFAARILLTLKDPTGAPIDVPNSRRGQPGCWGRMFTEFNGGKFEVNMACFGRDFNNGTYESYVVPVGRTVYVEGWPTGFNYKPVFYDQKPTLETATPIRLTSAGTVPITIVMGLSGYSISGRYSFGTTPGQITSATVGLYSKSGDLLKSQDAGFDGTFRIDGVDDGDYFIRVAVTATVGGARKTFVKFYLNASSTATATRVTVRGGNVSGIDMVLDTPATDPALRTTTTSISLIAPAGGTSDPVSVAIWSDAGDVSWTAASGSSSWLRVSPSSGSVIANNGARTIVVTADASTLAPGTYSDTLQITGSSGATLQIPVTLEVTRAASTDDKAVQTSVSSLVFNAEAGQFQAQSVTLTNPGTTRIGWNVRSPLTQSYPASGILEPGASTEIKIATTVSGLEFGSLTGQVDILTNGRVTSSLPITVNATPLPTPVSRTASTYSISGDASLTKVVPSVASNLPGAASSVWSSDVFLTNLPSKVLSNLTSFIFTPFGAGGSSSLLVRGPVKLPMTLLSSPISTMFRQSSGFGALDMRPGAPIATWSRVWTPARDGRGTYGQEILAFDNESVITPGEKGVIAVLLGGTYRSNLLLTETRGSAANVHVVIRNSSGAEIASHDIALDAFAQRSLNALVPTGVTTAYAELTVSDTGAVGALASLVDNQTNDPTTIMMSKTAPRTASGKLIVPGVARGPGANSSVWRSDVWLVNSSAAPLTFVPLLYVSGQNVPMTGKTYSVAAGAQVTLQDALLSDFSMEVGRGALLLDVRSGDAAAVRMISRTFNLSSAGGTLGQGVLAVRNTDEVKLGEPGLALFGLQRNRNFRTNLQIQETSGASASVEILATAVKANAVSDSLASPIVKVELLAYEFMQLGDILGLLGMSDELINPRLTLRVVGGSGTIMAYGSLIDSTTNDATTIPAFKLQP